MRVGQFIAILVVQVCVLAVPQAVQSAGVQKAAPSTDEAELLKACRTRLSALNRFDVATIDRYTHKDFIGTDEDGVRVSKAELLKKYAPHSEEPPNTYGPMEDVQVRIYGATAILNYRVQLRERFGDRDIVTPLRRTDVFLKDEGRWQEVSAQLTAIPMSSLAPVQVDAGTFNDYVGDYEIAPGNVDHVAYEDEKLIGESFRGKAQLLPLGHDRFFFREDTGQITFARDEAGRVNGYSYQRCDGQQIAARKVR